MPPLPLPILHPDPKNPNRCTTDVLKKLTQHMQRTGLCPTLVVRPHPSLPEQYQVIDGHHRLQVAQQLGWETLPCQIWNVSETEAKLALATLNRLRGNDIPQKRAELIADLLDTLPAPDLADLLPESEREIQDLLQLLSLETDTIQQALQAELEKEQAELPVALGFLLQPPEAQLVETALQQANPNNRADALIHLVKHYLEQAKER